MDVQLPFYTPTCSADQPCIREQQVDGRGASFLPTWVANEVANEVDAQRAHGARRASALSATATGPRSGAGPDEGRALVASFVGAVRLAAPYVVPAPDLTVGNRLRVALTCLHDPPRGVVVADPGDPTDWPCDPKRGSGSGGRACLVPDPLGTTASAVLHGSEDRWKDRWGAYYWRVMLASRFVFCPGGAGAHSQRINEAIAAGAVPVNKAGK